MSWGFKSNLILDNNKYLTLYDSTAITKSNIIGLDTNSNLNINSASGNVFFNSNNTGSETFLNFNNSKNVIISSKLAVGINDTSNINSNLTLIKNGFIGINTTRNNNDSYLGLAGSSSLSNTTGSRMLLYGNDNTNGNNGNLNLYAGNSSSGSINLFTGNDSNTFQILKTGTSNFSPNGSTIRLSISDTNSLFTHQVQFTNTNVSTSATTGSVLVNGGLGIVGDTYISGSLNIDSVFGNINFASTRDSINYTTGALSLIGGIAIKTSTLAVSAVNGGAMSVAGGFGLGGNAIFNSTLEVAGATTIGSLFTSTSKVGINRAVPFGSLHLASQAGGTYGNIVFEPGTTSDGANLGFSGMNFNGYFSGGEGRINTNKNRWRLWADQRSSLDSFYLDTFGTGVPLTTIFSVNSSGNMSIPVLSSTNLVVTNLSTGTLQASSSTIPNLVSTNLSTGTINNLVSTNISSGSINYNASYVFSGSCAAGNNIVTATNLLGIIFPTATTRSFTIIMSVSTLVSSGQNYFTQYTVEGIQTDIGWIIDDYFIGDTPNLTLTIINTGQLQYTSTNVSNWTSTNIRYHSTGLYI